MQSYKDYVHHLKNSRKIILAGLKQTRLPYSMIFPNVSELTIYRMDRYSFYYGVHSARFPNVRIINYLIRDDIDFEVYSDMGDNVIWKTLEKYTYPLLNDISKNRHIRLSNNQYFKILHDHETYHETYLNKYIKEHLK